MNRHRLIYTDTRDNKAGFLMFRGCVKSQILIEDVSVNGGKYVVIDGKLLPAGPDVIDESNRLFRQSMQDIRAMEKVFGGYKLTGFSGNSQRGIATVVYQSRKAYVVKYSAVKGSRT